MKEEDMIERLKSGEKAIDLSIEKWEDILEGTGSDDGGENCACCYVDTRSIEGSPDMCLTCPIIRYDKEQKGLHESDAVWDGFCNNLPNETDKEGVKKAIEYMKKVKEWMIEKGEY